MQIEYSRGTRYNDAHPENRTAEDFDEFTTAVLGDRAVQKGRQYVAASFKPNGDGRPHRCKAGALPTAFVAFDFDGFSSPEDWHETLAVLHSLKGFAYTTASATPSEPRARAVLAATRVMDRTERWRVSLALQDWLNTRVGDGCIKFDDSVYKSEQPLFCPPTEAETYRFNGELVNVNKVLTTAPQIKDTSDDRQRADKIATDDPVLSRLQERSMVLGEEGPGKYAVTCPFEDEHSEHTSDSATVYFLPNFGGVKYGKFHCLHGHCKGREQEDYLKTLDLEPRRVWAAQLGKTANPSERKQGGISLDDFHAHMPDHRYIFAPTRDMWPASSVNSRVPWIMEEGRDKATKPSDYLDRERAVEQMTWAPGDPMIVEGRFVDAGGWVKRPGVKVFNLYRPPTLPGGNPGDIEPWLNHIRRIYPNEADHLIHWMAHRVQHPGTKINHAIVLGGPQGIGKDTLLEPLKAAVGPWNFVEVSPAAMLGRFNSFVKSVVLRISEARDLGDMDRFAFYDHTKTYTAAPPDVLRCDEKNIREHSVLNVCGVIITTNHKSDGIYLPSDDRRHFVAWSDLDRTAFGDAYWTNLWKWYEGAGIANVAAYLRTLDLSAFNPKAPPPKTDAFWHIVNAGRAAEGSELADVVDWLHNPDALFLGQIVSAAHQMGHSSLEEWLTDRKSRRQIPHRLEEVGYEPVRNDTAKDGLWKIKGKRQVVYAQRALDYRSRLAAANQLVRQSSR